MWLWLADGGAHRSNQQSRLPAPNPPSPAGKYFPALWLATCYADVPLPAVLPRIAASAVLYCTVSLLYPYMRRFFYKLQPPGSSRSFSFFSFFSKFCSFWAALSFGGILVHWLHRFLICLSFITIFYPNNQPYILYPRAVLDCPRPSYFFSPALLYYYFDWFIWLPFASGYFWTIQFSTNSSTVLHLRCWSTCVFLLVQLDYYFWYLRTYSLLDNILFSSSLVWTGSVLRGDSLCRVFDYTRNQIRCELNQLW